MIATATTAATTPATSTASDRAIQPLVNGHIVLGTIVVDLVAAVGVQLPAGIAQMVPVPLPGEIESVWSGIRQQIYFGFGNHPLAKSDDELGTPIFQSDFDSLEATQEQWQGDIGRWGAGDGENQYYTNENWTVEDGKLVITVKNETPPDGAAAPDDYTSARVTTQGKETFIPPVRIEARIKMPAGEGLQSAFWTTGVAPDGTLDGWPQHGEIDVVERFGIVGVPTAGNIWEGNVFGPSQADPAVATKTDYLNVFTPANLSDEYHTYSVDYYPDKIVWGLDGNEVGVMTKEQFEAMGGDWEAITASPQVLILSSAVGNNFTGDPANTAFPQHMYVDWVKVCSLA